MSEPDIPLVLHPKPLIQDLQDRHITLENIAEALKIPVRTLCYMKAKNAEPRWSIGLQLLELHALNCSTATAVPSSIPA